MKTGNEKPLTHHDTSVETLDADCDDNVASYTFENFTSRDDETICVICVQMVMLRAFVLCLDAFCIRQLLDCIAFACNARLVTSDIVPSKEDAVTGDNLSWFEEGDIADDEILEEWKYSPF